MLRAGSKPAVEAGAELGEVRVEAEPSVGGFGIRRADLDQRRGQEPLHVPHRRDEALSLPVVERLEERRGERVAARVESRAFAAAGSREARRADASIGRTRTDRDHARGFQRAQHATQIAGVEVETRSQRAHVGTVGSDLPQHAGLAERTIPLQEPVVQDTELLRDGPVEPPDLRDRVGIHPLTLVRGCCSDNRRVFPPWSRTIVDTRVGYQQEMHRLTPLTMHRPGDGHSLACAPARNSSNAGTKSVNPSVRTGATTPRASSTPVRSTSSRSAVSRCARPRPSARSVRCSRSVSNTRCSGTTCPACGVG